MKGTPPSLLNDPARGSGHLFSCGFRSLLVLLVCTTVLVLAPNALALPGDLDISFNGTGKVITAIGPNDESGQGVVVQSDGKIVVAGSTSAADVDFAVVRYTATGVLDTSFGSGTGKVITNFGSGNDQAFAVALQADGKIVVAGSSSNGTNKDIAVARYTTAGVLDTTFNSTGKVTTAIGAGHEEALGVRVQSDGKIVVVGYSNNGTNTDFAVVRYTSAGALDTTFNSTGIVTSAIGTGDDRGESVALQNDGAILAAGYSMTGGIRNFAVVRYASSGALDTTFNSTGIAVTSISNADDYAYSVAVQSDGKIVAAGYSRSPGLDYDFAVVRYTSAGALDTTFNTTGKVVTNLGSLFDFGYSMVLQSDGRIVLVGRYHNGSNSDIAVARYTSTGVLDTTFNGTGKVIQPLGTGDDYGYAAAIQPDGKLVVAGQSHNGSNRDFAVVRYTAFITPGLLLRPDSLPNGLRGWWKLDEASGTRMDSSGNGNHLTSNNNVGSVVEDYWSMGERSADMESTSQQFLAINHASQTGLDLDGDSFTLAGWVKCESYGGGNMAVMNKGDWAPTAGYLWRIDSTGRSDLVINGSSHYGQSGSIPLNKWVHLAIIRNLAAGTIEFYVDGNLSSVAADSAAMSATTKAFCLGQYVDADGSFDGQMKDMAVWDRPLSPLQIKSLALGVDLTTPYRPGNVSVPPTAWWKLNEMSSRSGAVQRMDSVGTHHLTDAGNLVGTAGGYLEGAAARFAGNPQFLSGPTSPDYAFGTGDFTISHWIKFATITPQPCWLSLGKLQNPSEGMTFTYYSGQLYIYFQGAVNVKAWNWSPTANTWYHIALKRQGTVLTAFIDGVPLGALTSTENFVNTQGIYMGRDSVQDVYPFDGTMQDVAIWKGYALSAAEIKALATALPVQKSGNVSYWPLDEATGTRNDVIGTNTLNSINGVTSGVGMVGNAADFERDNLTYLQTSGAPPSLNLNGAFSIFAWLKTESGGVHIVADKNGLTGPGYTLDLEQDQNRAEFFPAANGGIKSNTGVIQSTWTHVGGVYDRAIGATYFNAAREGSAAHSTDATDTTTPLQLGARNGSQYFFDGLMDEVVIAKRWFRDEEVKAIYLRGVNGLNAFLSTNADLSALALSAGTLNPVFASGTTSYTANVGYNSYSLTVTPTVAQSNATIMVNGVAVTSGNASGSIPLNVGANTITVAITAQDGTTTKSYTVTVTRAAAVAGDVEQGFDPASDGDIFSAAMQADGKILIGGAINQLGGQAHLFVSRLNVDGTVEHSFNPSLNHFVNCLAVQQDGKILLGGRFTLTAAATRIRLARLNADGTLDPSLNLDADAEVFSLAMQPDGKIIIGGWFTTLGGVTRNYIARVNADGTLDASFNPNANNYVYSTAVQADGKIIIGGFFTTVGGVARNYIARLNMDGTLDSGFNPNLNARANSLTMLPDGKILIVGNFTAVGGVTRNRIARLNADGTLDVGFNPNANNEAWSAAVQTDGKIIVTGVFTTMGGVTRNRIARVNADGTLDTSFNPDANGAVWGTTLQPNGKIILGGGFTSVGGVARTNIARLENGPATQSLTIPSASRIEWLRGGTSPEAQMVTFELSTSGGTNYIVLGDGTRMNGGWELVGQTLPVSGQIRARARTPSGQYSGSSGLVETITTYSGLPVPDIAVFNGTTLTAPNERVDNTGTQSFGTADLASVNTVQTFSIRNDGTVALSGLALSIAGTNAGDFTLGSLGATTLAPGASTSFTVTFSPQGFGARNAVISIASNDFDETPFEIPVSGTGGNALAASFTAANSIPLTSNGFTATGSTVNFTLGYAPTAFTVLTLVNNTSANPISGTFANLAQGQTVVLVFNAVSYKFSADYFGGTGNDLVLALQGPGALDYTFNGSGKVTMAIGSGNDYGISPALQSDGKAVVAGYYHNGTNYDFAVSRYLVDGTLDTSFGTAGKVMTAFGTGDDIANRVVIQGDGKIVVAGVTSNGSDYDIAMARYNASGTLDTSFGSGGKAITAVTASDDGNLVRDLVLQADGKILAVGRGSGNSNANFLVARWNANGTPDTGFNSTGISNTDFFGSTDMAGGVALLPDGRIVVAGYAFLNGGQIAVIAAMRFNSDGTLDTTFNGTGKVTHALGDTWDIGEDMAIQPDGKMVISGYTKDGGTTYDTLLLRLTASGSLDTSFNGTGKAVVSTSANREEGNSVALQSDGKIIVAGYSHNGVNYDFQALRFTTTGALDTSFHGTGKALVDFSGWDDRGWDVVVQADGKILVAGESSNGSNYDFAVARLQGDSAHDATFASSSDVPLTSTGFTATGQTVNLTLGFVPPVGSVLTLVNNTGTSAISGEFTNLANGQIVPLTYNGITYNFAASYTGGTGNDLTLTALAGALDYTFNGSGKAYTQIGTGWDYADAVVVQADGKAVVGGKSAGSTWDFGLARYMADGTLDTGFGNGGKVTTNINNSDECILDLALQPDGKILAVGYAGNGNGNMFVLARYTASGVLDTTFNINGKVLMDYSAGDDMAYAVAVQSDGKIVVVGSGNTDSACVVLRYTTTGQLDTSFNSTGYVSTSYGMTTGVGRCLALQADGKILAGGWSANGQTDFAVARFNANGTLDTSFNGSGFVTTDISSANDDRANGMTVLADGRIILVGYSTPAYWADFSMLCLNPNGSLDTTFSGGGKFITRLEAATDFGQNVAATSDGKIVVVGNAGSQGAVLRFNSNGTYDSTWGNNGVQTTLFNTNLDHQLYDVALQSDGRIVAVGYRENGADLDFVAARFLTETVHPVTFASASSVPLNASNFSGAGQTVSITLGFAPSIGTELTLVKNTGTSPIATEFTNLPNGATVPLTYNNVTYNFIANYTGGTGNDLTLLLPGVGGLDYTFNGSGRVTTAIGTLQDYAQAVAVQSDGKTVVAGFIDSATINDFAVARYNVNGTLDASFGTGGRVITDFTGDTDYGRSVLIQPDGKILLAGQTYGGGRRNFALVRYTAAGALDTSFGSGGKVSTAIGPSIDEGFCVALQSDGKIVMGGASYNGTNHDFALVRYLADGSLDTTFNGTGKVTTAIGSGDEYGKSVTIQSDGRIVLAGHMVGAANELAVARYNANGSLDTTFNGTGKATTAVGSGANGQAMLVQSDGKIVVAGYAVVAGNNDFALVRYNTNGSLDSGFGTGGRVTSALGTGSDIATSITQDIAGRLLVVGYSNNGSNYDFALVRYSQDGTLDTSFSGDGKTTLDFGNYDDQAMGVTTRSDGSVVVAGFAYNGIKSEFALVRYLGDTTLNASFAAESSVPLNANGITATGRTLNVTLGFAPTIGTELLLVNNTGTNPITGTFTNIANGATVPLVFNAVTYNFTANYTGGTGNDLTLLLPGPGALDYTFNGSGKVVTAIGGGDDYVQSMAVQSDGKVLVAGTSANGGNLDFAVLRYNANGLLDTSFNSTGKATTDFGGSDDYGYSVAVQSDGKIIVAGSTGASPNIDLALVRYNNNGSLDASFGSGGKVTTPIGSGNNAGYSVTLQSNGKIVVAGEAFTGVHNDIALVRYTSTGTLDTSFGSGGIVTTPIGSSDDAGHSVAVQSDGKIVVAGDSDNGSNNDFAVVRYNSDGSLDSGFGSGGKVTTPIGTFDTCRSMVLQRDGKIVAAGWMFNGSTYDFALVRYNTNGTLDTSFDSDGKVVTLIGSFDARGYGVALQSDGKIVAGGFASISGGSDFAVARYNTDGSLDATFRGTGTATTNIGSGDDLGFAVAVQPDGRIVLAGYASNGSNYDFALARYLVETTLDTTFASALDIPLTTNNLNATGRTLNVTLGFSPSIGTELLLVNNTGSSAITGSFTNIANGATVPLTFNSVIYNFIANYSGGTGNDLTLLLPGPGGLDYTFNGSGRVTTALSATEYEENYAMAVQNDGRILLTSGAYNGTNYDFGMARYLPNGLLDGSFGTGGVLLAPIGAGNDFSAGMAVQPDGKILVAGQSYNGSNPVYKAALARFQTNGALDSSIGGFNGTGIIQTILNGQDDRFYAVAVQPDGKVVAAGRAHGIGVALMRFLTDGTVDTSFNPGNNGKLMMAVESANGDLWRVAVQQDGKIVAVGSTAGIDGPTSNFLIVRCNTNGTLDTTFNSSGTSTVNFNGCDYAEDVALLPDGKILVAGSGSILGNSSFALTRLNADGTVDGTFGSAGKVSTDLSPGEDMCFGMEVQADGKIVLGGNSGGDFAVVRYLANGSLDTSFREAGKAIFPMGAATDKVLDLAIQTDGKIVLSGYSFNGSTYDFALARLTAETTSNVTFASAGDVPLNANGFTAAGRTVNLTLNYAPTVGTSLKVFDNTSLQPIAGEFTNLAQGQVVTLNYNSVNYSFVTNYFGGDGNDLVLQWANTKLAAFGANDSGQLGVSGGVTQANVPTQVVATAPIYQKTITAMSAGQAHSLAVCSDGTVAAWGSNVNGQLGNGTTTSASMPVAVTMSGVLNGKKVIAVAAGSQHSLALCSDGTLAAWGDGSFGQIGDNGVLDRTSPVLVSTSGALSGKRVIAISAGATHSAALCSDGTVFCWGDNANGELGNGNNTRSLVPVAVTTSGVLLGHTVTAIACGLNHTLALRADGTLASWGSNSNQQLGNFSGVSRNTPVAVITNTALLGKQVASIAAGGNQNLVLCTDGSLAAWGEDDHGQIGTVSTFPNWGSPQSVVQNGTLAGKTVTKVGFGAKHAFVVCSDGSMAAWGLNSSGQLGVGDTTDRIYPVTTVNAILGPNETFMGAASGAYAGHTLALIGTTTNAPMIQVEQSGLVLVDNAVSGPSFGGIVVGSTESVTFTVRNVGTQILSSIAASLSGAGQSHYAITQSPANTLAPGDVTTLTLAFTPTTYGGKPVTLRIASNLSGALNPFDLNISGTGNPELYATWLSANDVPAVAGSFDANSKEVIFTLGFAPATGATLMVLNNTGTTFIDGYFDSAVYGQLVHGQDVELDFNGTTYTFIADYFGGDGNDLVLRWAGTRLLAWGAGTSGQLGNSASSNSSVPVVVNMSTGALVGKRILYVTCGANHSVALCADGTLAAWGSNASGQLGNNNATGNSNVPVAVLDPNNALLGRVVVGIAAGADFTLALCSDGKVAAWGRNIEGQLGNNNTGVNSPVPVLVSSNGLPGGKTVTAIAAGGTHALARCSDGSVYAWGSNGSGQLGNGGTTTSGVPVAVDMSGVLAGKKVARLAAGYSHSHVVCTDGSQAAWGDDGFGALGNNSTTSSPVPVLVDMTGALAGRVTAQMGAGQFHSAWLAKDGTLLAWGRNNNAQLAIATSTAYSSAPFVVPMTGAMSGKTISDLAVGRQHHVVQLTDGSLASWGLAGSGQLGNGATTPSPTVTPASVNLSILSAGEKILRVSSGTGALHNISLVAQPITLPGGPPVVTTNAATAVDKTTATLNGLVSPNSLATNARFEFGLDTGYGTQTAIQAVGSGSSSVSVVQALTGLQSNTTYHYRITATNSGGTANGSDLTFTTLKDPPSASTGAASAIANTSATLNGSVNPNGRVTTVSFELSTDPTFASGVNTIGTQQVATGTSLVPVSTQASGLLFGTTYYYRVTASTAGGAAEGVNSVSFVTTSVGIATQAPTISSTSALNITTTSARLQGSVNPNGGLTNVFFEYGAAPGFGTNSINYSAGSGTSPQTMTQDISGLLPATQYQFRLVAENNFNNSTTTTGTTITFTTLPLPPVVDTQAATALSTTSARLNGTVRAQNGSAAVTFEWGTDGVNFPNSLAGTPSPVTGDTVTAVSADVTNLQQFTTYSFRVKATSAGGTTTGNVMTFQPQIISGLTLQFPAAPSAATGSVTVTQHNGGSTMGWRFVGEQQWRAAGATVGGMTTGDRDIEYRAVPGYIQPPQETVSIVAGQAAVQVDREYYLTPVSGSGGLNVTLKPDTITSGAGRAQWRLLGEDDTQWRDSGVTLSSLAAGTYLIECKPVAGRATPAITTVLVSARATSSPTITYFLADSQTGTLPSVLSFSTVSTDSTKPYAHVGQIRSNVGLSSGFVVKARVVATAGHVVFDDGTLSAAQGLQWLFQRDAGTYEPKPITPRGFYIFDGYATQRATENTPGSSSPQSQNLDVAAIYFNEDAGRGGFGGFLASDLTNNEFLLSAANKTLVGYPIDGIAPADQGRMHATPITNVTFTNPFGRTFATTGIRSSGGNSGGPLCVQHNNGNYYAAAVYLGGTNQTVVRAIDSSVIDLFNRAETSGSGGANNTGGGITHTSVSGSVSANPGSIQVVIEPAGARTTPAGWRLLGSTSSYKLSGNTQGSLAAGVYQLDLTTIAGYQAPTQPNVTVTGGQQTIVTFTYAPTVSLTPQESWRVANFGSSANSGSAADSADPDGDGMTNLAEYTAGTNPNSRSDVFKVSSHQKTGSSFTLTTAGKSGRTYFLERSGTLDSASWTTVTTQGPLEADASVTLTDASSPAGRAFYRIRVTGP